MGVDLAFVEDIIVNDAVGGGATLVYTMRAVQNGSATVYWDNENAPDTAGTGPNAPAGTLTDVIVFRVKVQ